MNFNAWTIRREIQGLWRFGKKKQIWRMINEWDITKIVTFLERVVESPHFMKGTLFCCYQFDWFEHIQKSCIIFLIKATQSRLVVLKTSFLKRKLQTWSWWRTGQALFWRLENWFGGLRRVWNIGKLCWPWSWNLSFNRIKLGEQITLKFRTPNKILNLKQMCHAELFPTLYFN